MVGYLVSTDTYFRTSNGTGYDGTESHFGVGGKWGPDLGGGWDGRIWQWQDLLYQADANYEGNPRIISIETADNAPASADDIEPWTDLQLDSLIDLCAWLCTPAAHADCPPTWLCHQEGIPAQLVPDTQSSRRGLAYHAQGAAEHTVGEWWSLSKTKPCPTRRRIDQFKAIVIPGVQARLAGTPEDDMPTIDELNAAAAAGQLDPFFRRQTAILRDTAGLAKADQITTAVIQLAGRITDAKSGVIAALEALPVDTDGMTDAERQKLVADIIAGVDALGQDDAEAVAEKLAARPATVTFGPAAGGSA